MGFYIPGWISWADLSNSFRTNRPGVFYKKICKILQNPQKNTGDSLFLMQFFRVTEIQKLRAKQKI